MTAVEAAKVIGCDPSHVRSLIRSGKIRAKKKKSPIGDYWDITPREARRYRDKPQTHGFPRGQSRK